MQLGSNGTIVDEVLPRPSARTAAVATDVLLVAAGTGLVAAAAQVSIPWYPVPFTGQTFAVLLVGGLLGMVRGTLALGLYLALGALGAGIFSEASGGWDVITGPTGGYIVGFILAAGFIGFCADRGADRNLMSMIGVFVVGHALIFLVGVWWLAEWTPPGADSPLGWSAAYTSGLEPFWLSSMLKIALAGMLLPGGWALVRRLRGGTADEPRRGF